ncbi:MAG: hypothetical protein ABL949_07470 [Fimbriimonadaceae bacterium]
MIRMVQLAKRANQEERPVLAVLFPLSDSGDLLAIVLSEEVAEKVASNRLPWEQRLQEVSEKVAPFVKPVVAALDLDAPSEPSFVFDMHAVAIESMATAVGSTRHSAVLLTSHLNTLDSETVQIVVLTTPERLERSFKVHYAEAA